MPARSTAAAAVRRGLHFALAALCLLAVARAPSPPAARAQEQFVVKLASSAPIGSIWHQHLRAIAKHLEETTGGHLRVKLLAGGALGDDSALLPRLAEGSVQAYAGPAHALAASVPAVAILGAPAALGSGRSIERRLGGPVSRALEAQLASAGLVFASWSAHESRVWLSRETPIRRPRDLRQKRAPRTGIASLDAFAADALSITLLDRARPLNADALTSSQVDVVDDTLLSAVATGRDNWARHVTLSEHAVTPWLVVYSAHWFEGLPEQIKQDLTTLPPTLLKQARDDAATERTTLLAHLRARGVEVHEPSKAELRAFGRSGRVFTGKLARELGPDARRLLSAAARR